MGSKIEVKKAPVDKQAKVMEILETLMALKKVIQCKAIIKPETSKETISLLDNLKLVFLYKMYPKINKTANDIRHQTNGKASNEISLPKMAVNPQMNTIK